MVIALVILLSHQVFLEEPLLSTIFINDIENAVDIAHCALFKFAPPTLTNVLELLPGKPGSAFESSLLQRKLEIFVNISNGAWLNMSFASGAVNRVPQTDRFALKRDPCS